jgi:hypothetical protein
MSPGVVWCGGGVVFFLTDNNTIPTKVVLSCFDLSHFVNISPNN